MKNKIFHFPFSIFKRACPAKLQRSGGFTVLESIVAIFILSLAISGAFAAVVQGLSQANIAKDETQAFYLAQEAIEIIRNKRDINQIERINTGSGHWLRGMSEVAADPCYFGKICKVAAYSMNFSSCAASWGSCENLRQNTSSHSHPYLYNHSAGNPTKFKREIMFEQAPTNPDEVIVVIRISWTKGVITRDFKVKTSLFNWI